MNPISTHSSAATPPAWQPRIVAFFCNWCTYTAADLAGVSRTRYSPSARVIRLMCSGRLDPQLVLAAFARGADGVLVGGCHPGDCHYLEGNYKTSRRFHLLRRLLADLGIDEQRLRLEWISAAEGEKVKSAIDDMTEDLRQLGPLNLPAKHAEWDQEMEALETEVKEAERLAAQTAPQTGIPITECTNPEPSHA